MAKRSLNHRHVFTQLIGHEGTAVVLTTIWKEYSCCQEQVYGDVCVTGAPGMLYACDGRSQA